MSSSFNMPGNYGFLSTASSRMSFTKFQRGDWLLYLLAALIVFAIVMMLRQIKIDWSWLDPRPKRMIVTNNSELFWKPSSQFVNLSVPSDSIKEELAADTYSMSLDTVLYNTRNYTGTEGPYRHIVHRGSDELATSTIGGAIVSGCAALNSSSLPAFGLPKRLNPGIFLDPNLNDIIVFVDTHLGAENYRESVRIADIPLDIPFRLGVVLKGRVLEVYLNCRLEVTKVLTGEPKRVESDWYGLSGSAAAQAQIQNLYLWNNALTSDEIKVVCSELPTFPKVRPICAGADSVIASPAQATQNVGQATQNVGQTTQIDLGFGKQISTCAR